MAVLKKQKPKRLFRCILIVIFLVVVFCFFLIGCSPDEDNSSAGKTVAAHPKASFEALLRASAFQRRNQLKKALKSIGTHHLPERLRLARENHMVVGEHLSEIREGSETVEEILHAGGHHKNELNQKPPLELSEIIEYIYNWIQQLHEVLLKSKHGSYEEIWKTYHDLTVKTLYQWDRDYLKRMPKRRTDGSIFLSIATYRDENCLNTMTQAYGKAKNPEGLFVGLVQQNCHKDCKSGVLENMKMEPVPPDDDCYALFCKSKVGKKHCEAGRVRTIMIDESESLGPYAARFFASKLWYGEEWYMQIDAHMTFATHWDASSIEMLEMAPSRKPVLSHYPPAHTQNLDEISNTPGSRLCGPIFATSDLENQIVRLEGSGRWDKEYLEVPRFAPFTAAGYFVAHSSFLQEVPFDPFLPWIFMGEEIIMSSRLWTSGYDIFSPSRSVVGHIYVRRHKPKFWESVSRAFSAGVHNPLQMMILDRIKFQLGYPEAAIDLLPKKSILTAVEQYSMGKERSLRRYLEMVGLNMTTKEVHYTKWCETGNPPPGFEEYAKFYKK